MTEQKFSEFFSVKVKAGWLVALILALSGQAIDMYARLAVLEHAVAQVGHDTDEIHRQLDILLSRGSKQ